MITYITVLLSVLLALSIGVGALGWYRYFVLMQILKVFNAFLDGRKP